MCLHLFLIRGWIFIALEFCCFLQVKVVIIDSITFHFRQDFEDMALRTRLLSGMALKLMKLAQKFNLAVRTSSLLLLPSDRVVTNASKF